MNVKSIQKKNVRRISMMHLFLIAAAMILQIASVNAMMTERGSFQFGGEWLLTPMLILLYFVMQEGVRQAKKELRSWICATNRAALKSRKIQHQKAIARATAASVSSKKRVISVSKPIQTISVLRSEQSLLRNAPKQYMHAS